MEENKELQNQNAELNAQQDENSSTVEKTGVTENSNEQPDNEMADNISDNISDEKADDSQIEEQTEQTDSLNLKEKKSEKSDDEDPDDEELSKRLVDQSDHESDGNEDDGDDYSFDEEAFNNLSREDLLHELEEAVKVENVFRVNAKITKIQIAFHHRNKEKKQEDYETFVKQGVEDAKFVEQIDEIEIQFNQLFDVYKKKKTLYHKKQEERKNDNLKIRKELLVQLRELINSEEPLKITYHIFKKLQRDWKNAGMIPRGEMSELWKNYHFLVEKFFDKVEISHELRALGLKKNLEKKIILCEQAEELLLEENIHTAFKVLQKYHNKWREIGSVPIEQNEPIWQRFKAVSDEINKKRKKYFDQLNSSKEENYAAKIALCEKAEALGAVQNKTVKDWLNNTDKMNELFKLWRSVGRVPDEKNDEIWNRFKGEMDKFFDVKKEFFDRLKDEQKENYNKKLDIVKEAEAIKDSSDWKETKQQLVDLQKEWKQIGSVPRKFSDKIWRQFRAACDHFFNRRDEIFKDRHKHEEENLKKKEALLEAIKAFELSDNKNNDIEILKQYQRDWFKIGFVPIDKKEAIQSEFMGVVDNHFDKLKVSLMEKKAINFKQKVNSMKENPASEKQIYRERISIENKINRLEENIKLWDNNIGFLANSKKADFLKVEFERKIEKARQEHALLKSELRYINED